MVGLFPRWPAHQRAFHSRIPPASAFDFVNTTLICLALIIALIGAMGWVFLETVYENHMAKLNELTGTLTALVAKAEAQEAKSAKILEEVTQLRSDFNALKETLDNVELPADATAALVALDARLDAIAAKQAAVDDVNPDAPTATA